MPTTVSRRSAVIRPGTSSSAMWVVMCATRSCGPTSTIDTSGPSHRSASSSVCPACAKPASRIDALLSGAVASAPIMPLSAAYVAARTAATASSPPSALTSP